MVYIYTDIEVDIDKVFDSMPIDERKQWIKEVLEEDEYVPDGWYRVEQPKHLAIEDDAAYRLEVITWLRANGWTVEPK